MRVLAVSSYGVLGGGELSLAAFLEHRPADVEARVLLVSDGPLRELVEGLGVPVSAASGLEGRPGPGALRRFTRTLSPLLRDERPDVVWATGQKAALLSVPASRRHGVPVVWHKIDFSWDRMLARPLARAAHGVVAVSSAVAEPLGGRGRRKLLGVVGPPLRLAEDLRARPDPERPAIGTLARLVPYKGHHHIVRAAALLSGEFPTLRVVLAGASEPQYSGYEESLRALARESELGDRLELTGHVDNVRPVLEGLSVYVNATYRDEQGFGLEGLSGAMLEASWAGIPVVAARGGGTAEGLVDGVTGTLVDSPDPAVLAGAIAPYLRDGELARRAGEAGSEFARANFAPEHAAERLFTLLRVAAER